jgi:ribonuclease D
MGLKNYRDRLCVVQLTDGKGDIHLIQFAKGEYHAPNLVKYLVDPSITKIFHFARFDVSIIYQYLGVLIAPIYCTKIASRLARTYTDGHSLRELCRELIGVNISKSQQSSDWGADNLSPEQIEYAAADVLYLHRLRKKLDIMLEREGRQEIARKCFEFLPYRAKLDVFGWENIDIFIH